MSPEVKIIRLISGEEIIARVTKVDEHTITIEDPFAIMMSPPKNPGDSPNLHMVPMLQFAKRGVNSIDLMVQVICFTYSPAEPLENKYRGVTSGLALPPGI